MKRLKKEKVKRGRIILSAILTFTVGLLSLAFGAYLGHVTLNINYITLGTMTTKVGGLLVTAGFFIFFGCVGGTIALKEIFISSRNEEKFVVYKPALISASVYYIITAIISIVGIIMAFVSYVPSNNTWTIIALSVFTLLLCASAFYCVFKELKEHKKKTKKKNLEQETNFANMQLSASEVFKFSEATKINEKQQGDFDNKQNQELKQGDNRSEFYNDPVFKRAINEAKRMSERGCEIDFYSLAEKLMQLEELRKAGLINDQEYAELKRKCIV